MHAPAIWTLIGAAAALFGLLPQATTAAWAVLAASALVVLLGRALDLPDWTTKLVPFTHVPAVPAEPLTAAPLVLLTAVAAALAVAGLAGLRHRDLG